MNNLLSILSSLLESMPNRVVISFLLLFILLFIFKFGIPAFFLGRKMGSAIKHLKKIKAATNGSDLIDLDPIVIQAMTTKTLKHLWSEYTETLHPQKSIDESGQERVICWRATTMAEAFFTEQVLVDTPLKTEFFKHLPGILTGLGIIGTFAGSLRDLPSLRSQTIRMLLGHVFAI